MARVGIDRWRRVRVIRRPSLGVLPDDRSVRRVDRERASLGIVVFDGHDDGAVVIERARTDGVAEVLSPVDVARLEVDGVEHAVVRTDVRAAIGDRWGSVDAAAVGVRPGAPALGAVGVERHEISRVAGEDETAVRQGDGAGLRGAVSPY